MGRQGWMKPTGRVRGRANIGWKIVQLGRIAEPILQQDGEITNFQGRDAAGSDAEQGTRHESRAVFGKV